MGAALRWLSIAIGCGWLVACSVKSVDLDGRACPCAPGYVCNVETNECVKSLDGTGGTAATGGTGGVDRDSGAGGTGGLGDRDSGEGGSGDAALPYDASALADARVGFDAATTFDAGPMCPNVAGSGTCPAVCTRCENGTCIVDCNYPYACGLAQLKCPMGWACSILCSSAAGACSAPLSVQCADGPCLIQCASGACLGSKMVCGSGACEARCNPGSGQPAVECGSACSCTGC
jgi:hypothetical protein